VFTYFVSYVWPSKTGGMVTEDALVAIHSPVTDGESLGQLREAVWQTVQTFPDYAGGAGDAGTPGNGGIVLINFILLSSPGVATA